MQIKVWRPIPSEYSDLYEVSSDGDVRRAKPSPRQPVTGRPLRPQLDRSTGYLKVAIHDGHGNQRTIPVHVLVCKAFHGPRPDGMHVRHLNGDQNDNRAANLAWGTPSQNGLDKRRHGTSPLRGVCIRGHQIEEVVTKSGRRTRRCNVCARMRAARRRAYVAD